MFFLWCWGEGRIQHATQDTLSLMTQTHWSFLQRFKSVANTKYSFDNWDIFKGFHAKYWWRKFVLTLSLMIIFVLRVWGKLFPLTSFLWQLVPLVEALFSPIETNPNLIATIHCMPRDGGSTFLFIIDFFIIFCFFPSIFFSFSSLYAK